jgi:lathosterol oxidase
MLCELHNVLGSNFLLTWLLLSISGIFAVAFFSGSVFLSYYSNPTYQQWKRKINPEYPTPEKVRSEILQTLKGLAIATICPALSLYLAQNGQSKAFCGVTEHYGIGYNLASFVLIWIVSDFYEFFYHHLGHRFMLLWDQHKAHHHFFNPSPFAVIADDAIDQFVRSAPLLIFPLLVPINIDILFGTFAVFFYGYGTVLHWGYESEYLSAHNKFINSSYEHYFHHAFSIGGKPIYTGFFFKAWDQLFGSVPDANTVCVCSRCELKKGNRSEKKWFEVKKPDYSILLKPTFWMQA